MEIILVALYLGISAVCIGVVTGATGIGGFLIIPAMMVIASIDVRTAIGTALVISAATGLLGASLYHSNGNLSWTLALPLIIGASFFATVGGWLNQWLPVNLIAGALGCTMLFGGASVLKRAQKDGSAKLLKITPFDLVALVLIGSLSGLVAGLTGAGGPLVSVPLMTVFSFPVLGSIGASQLMQIAASLFGAPLYWQTDNISLFALTIVIPCQMLGTVFGVKLSHAVNVNVAARGVASLGILGGAAILWVAIKQPLFLDAL
ncbi:sulfite exporter TauE/SafE family protein [Allopusillimonas ginsengisoli]|uniref:sulfite exporter TauE/SafE family protein n=1 Tax=Allopusillimonas ginsengisoli TaxID=453575 RepID=UPI0010224F64|nr:sulfite exporter TauE/SafE family protein [Allopusillimonas ginsengisoli]TEA77075.1 sulfite exporter TauE/SafE family protein [Allopusillimonas ginsengisoli]